MKAIIVIVWVVVIGTYIRTWNKYYFAAHEAGEETSFAKYIKWLKTTYFTT